MNMSHETSYYKNTPIKLNIIALVKPNSDFNNAKRRFVNYQHHSSLMFNVTRMQSVKDHTPPLPH